MTMTQTAREQFEEPPEGAMPDEDAEMPFFDQGGPEQEEGNSKVADVRRKHEGKLLKIDGVEGVSIESDEIGEDIIVVFVRDESVRGKVPDALEGVPIRVEVTGEFDAFLSAGDVEAPEAAAPERKTRSKAKRKSKAIGESGASKGKAKAKRAPSSLSDVVGKTKGKSTSSAGAKAGPKAKPRRTTARKKS